MKSNIVFGALLAAGFATAPAAAADLIYTPVDPSFGGNPLNSSHLLGLANAQRDATASDAKKNNNGTGTGGGTGGGTSQSDVDLFIQQLQGRLLSALASQVTDAIFPSNGSTAPSSGTIKFGDTTVAYERDLSSITLTITAGDGTVTTIVVPQLVTTNALTTQSQIQGLGGSPSSGQSNKDPLQRQAPVQ
jgi:curli production assembly/transport component CsgF